MKHVGVATVSVLVLVVTAAKGQSPPPLTLKATGGEVTCIGFSSDGQVFFSGALDSYVSVWTTKDWKQSANIKPAPPPKAPAGEHQDEFRALEACVDEPNTVRVMIASGGDLVSTHSLPSGRQVGNHRLAANFGSLAISSDGSELAAGAGSKITVLAVSSWKKRGTLSASGLIGTLRYAPKGTLLAVAIEHGGIQLWDTKSETLVRTFRTAGSTEQMSFSPDGRWLAAAVWDLGQKPRARVWDVATGSEVTSLIGHNDHVWGVAFSPDGKFLVSGDASGDVRVWKVASWQSCLQLQASGAQQVAISPDGHWLAAGGGTFEVSLWDFRSLVQSCR